MSKVTTVQVTNADVGMRLDRWFKQQYPDINHARLQKLLRTGQVRVDGGRVKSGTRLEEGQEIRVPPLVSDMSGPAKLKTEKPKPAISKADAKDIQGRVLHRDDDVIIINKPPGLAVQGGSRLSRHVDGMLDALRYGLEERPRLVHRLDKDTSGILLLARHSQAARMLTRAFRGKEVRKIYWAVVVGAPSPDHGTIDLPLGKMSGAGGEKVVAGAPEGKNAETLYRTADHAGDRAAWVVFEPLTGRTHQLRVHAQALGTPILGDGKYGRRSAFLDNEGIAGRLHLHARALRFPHPNGHWMEMIAPLPEHIQKTFEVLGFKPKQEDDSFPEIPVTGEAI
ncbi:MAG: RluA family pseudouridine synthase [Alphaproteobacteria bacterium]|jgi:23S rRNA pseudouridine955/2504/2580 synthase|nr:RluA family pseudouridine synthase [Alphaproteobacteria bacterium]MBT7942096.1 RluA family pseudouridine synthase [Alphaproteobacteria bacterium]